MKKLVMTAIAAGTLAVGGVASAQDIGSTIINGILSLAGATGSSQQMYVDQYGRQFYYDQYGRQVYVQANPYNNSNIVGYDAWGRPVYGSTSYSYNYSQPSYSYSYPSYGNYAYGGSSWDYDGDGVSNSRDRWPNDARYR